MRHLTTLEHSTLPADDKNKSKPLPAAYAEDVAIILPRKHCAFIECAWCGEDENSQAMHIVNNHIDLLDGGMEAYKQYKTMTYDSDAVLALSVYNVAALGHFNAYMEQREIQYKDIVSNTPRKTKRQ